MAFVVLLSDYAVLISINYIIVIFCKLLVTGNENRYKE